jgi:hypothetical protein
VLPAHIEVVFHGVDHRLFDFIDGPPLERDYITNPDYFSVENVGVTVELNLTNIPIVLQHGFTPAFDKNFLTETIAPLSASFCGCGRWKVAKMAFNMNRTREPLPSSRKAPRASKRASMSFQAIPALVGVSKISLEGLPLFAVHSMAYH